MAMDGLTAEPDIRVAHGLDEGDVQPESYRGGSARIIKEVLVGKDGSRDNYRLNVSEDKGKIDRPRHRHNFDQLRLVLRGAMNYGPDCWIREGEIGYFPEGTPYGPEANEDADRFGITIQFGGPSGWGFMSGRQMEVGQRALKALGKFEGGIFKRTGDLAEGERRNQDAHEAIWEYLNKRKIEYPKPRYDEPILMRPANFPWIADPQQKGVSTKLLGIFNERRTEISLIKVEAGATCDFGTYPALRLYSVLAGKGAVNGEAIRYLTSFEVKPGAPASVTATETLEIMLLGFPIFTDQSA
jgi:hypothetical protein